VLKDLLECHMYLKIYLIWGTEKVWELQDQKDLFSHLRYRYLPTCSATLSEFVRAKFGSEKFCVMYWLAIRYLSRHKTKF
jgi:hypothetical protein